MIEIIINGEPFFSEKNILSYDEIVEQCNCGRSKKTNHSVTFRKGRGKTEGIVLPGESIQIQDGTTISSAVTDSA